MDEMIKKMITRRSIRKYQNRQIEEEALQQILQAGLSAPSAGNNQYFRIVVCQDKQVNEKLGKINRFMQFKGKDPGTVAHAISEEQPSIQDDFTILSGYYNAPTVLTIFTKNHKYAREDAAVISENLLLAAHFLGLGACYIGRAEEVFHTEYGMEIRKKWGIPEDMTAVCSVLLGYRQGNAPRAKPQKKENIILV